MNPVIKRLSVLIALLTAAISLGACSLLPPEEERRVSPVLRETAAEEFELAYVSRGDLSLTKKISCTYVPIQKVSLYFQVAGEQIDDFYVQVGDNVKKGDFLGQLKMDGVDEQIQACERGIERLNLQLKHIEQDRALALRDADIRHAGDRARHSEAIADVNASYDARRQSVQDSLTVQSARLDAYLQARAARQLYAPIDGTVTYVRKYQDSSVSSPTERVIGIADSTMSLFVANTEYWEMFRAGDRVTITLHKNDYEAEVADEAALGLVPAERVSGKKAQVYFTLVTPAFDIEDNDKGSILLELDSRKDVLRVSEKAVSRANGQTIVYYQDEDGMKAYKPVEIGLNAEGMYEILSGLTEGEAVIAG